MDYRTLEITIISAEGIKDVSHLGKLRPYCVAYVDPSQKQTTHIDKEGSTYPKWDKTFTFTVPESSFHHVKAYLTVEIYHKSSVTGGSTLIGRAKVPLPDILRDSLGSGKAARLSYQIMRRSGRPQGSLNVSVKLGDPIRADRAAGEPVMAYPAFPETLPTNPAPPRFYNYPNSSKPLPQGYPSTPYYAPPSYTPPVVQPAYQTAYRPSSSRPGLGLGTGLLAGALGGLILGDVIGDMAYGPGYGGGFDGGFGGGGFDGGGFDGGFGF